MPPAGVAPLKRRIFCVCRGESFREVFAKPLNTIPFGIHVVGDVSVLRLPDLLRMIPLIVYR
jgi:hypothetical protein